MDNQNKNWLTVLGAVGVLLVLGGGVWAYSKYVEPPQPPERIVEMMVEKSLEVKTSEFSGSLKVKAAGIEEGQKGEVNINFSGVSDAIDPKNQKGSFLFDFRVSGFGVNEMLGDFNPRSEMRMIGRVIYIKVDNLPDITDSFIDRSKIENQWVKIDLENLGDEFGLEGWDEVMAELEKQEEFSEEKMAEMKAAFLRSNFIKITKKLPDAILEGVDNHHFAFTINGQKFVDFIKEFFAITSDKVLTPEEEADLKDLEMNLGLFDMFEGELWIGKEDLMLYKILLNVTIKEEEDMPQPEEKDPKDMFKLPTGVVMVEVIMQFKNFNKPVVVEVPTPTKSVQEFVKELWGKDFPMMP